MAYGLSVLPQYAQQQRGYNSGDMMDILSRLSNANMPTYGSEPRGFDSEQGDGGLKTLRGLGKSFGAARYNLRGTDLGPMKDLASQMGDLARAQHDPNDPMFTRLADIEGGESMQDLSEAIAEMSRQNRKLSISGRTPLFSPERGGETIFRGLTRGYQDAQKQARHRAREILGAGQDATRGVYNAYGDLTGAQDVNEQKKAHGIGNIADMIPLLGSIL